jgi:hypothetical protein
MPVRSQALPAKVPFSVSPLPGFVSIKAIWNYYNHVACQKQLENYPVTYVSELAIPTKLRTKSSSG